MNDKDEFVLQVIEAQSRVSAYVYTLVLDGELTREIVQRTNVVLLEKQNEFHTGTDFVAWARRIAFYEIMAYRRDSHRDRHMFDDEMLAVIATEAEKTAAEQGHRMDALTHCLSLLPGPQQELILARYRPGGSVSSLGKALGKSPAAISSLLHRIRKRLVDCVQRKLASSMA